MGRTPLPIDAVIVGDNGEPLLRVAQVARRLAMSRAGVYKAMTEGRLPFSLYGKKRHLGVPPSAVDGFTVIRDHALRPAAQKRLREARSKAGTRVAGISV